MSYTRQYFKLLVVTLFCLRTGFGQQATCLPLNGSDVNHPNGLFVQLGTLKTYSGPRQNTTSTYIVELGQFAQLLWDNTQGLNLITPTLLGTVLNTELTGCLPTPATPPTPPVQSAPYQNTPLALASHVVAATDFNGDGFIDAAVLVPGTNQVAIYLGTSTGTFQAPAYNTIGTSTSRFTNIVAADLNGDKKPDIAVVDNVDNAVYVLFGKGDGTFFGPKDTGFTPVTLTVGHAPVALLVADINGDGYPDIEVTNSADGTVSVIRGLGNGTFIPAQTFTVGKNPVSIIEQDINQDGNADLVVADSGSSDIAVLFGLGTGAFQPAAFTKSPVPPTYLGSADFNDDGKPDVVALSEDLNAVATFLGGFQGKLTFAGAFVVPNLSASLSINDFNGDGFLDLLIPDTDTGQAVLLLGRGDGTFNAPSQYGGSSGFTSMATADFNGDGKLDLVTTGANSTTSTLSLLLGQGNGQFQTPVNIPVSGSTGVIGVGDFNKDGRPDIAVSGTQLNIVLNTGGGMFKQGAQYPNLAPSVVADVNKDGNLDLVGPLNGRMGVMLGNGDGTFRVATSFAAGSNPATAIAADFNHDGNIDIAMLDAGTPASSADPGGVQIMLGNGTGTFAPAANVQAGFNPRAFAVADVNNDGKPDLVVATAIAAAAGSGYQLSVFLGKGDGTFMPPFGIPIPAGETPNTLAVVDLNGDGFPDIVVGDCCRDATTSYFRGNGDGTFQPLVPFYGGNDAHAIVTGDWNGDGKPDLALGTSPSDNSALSSVVALVNHETTAPSLVNTSGASFIPSPLAPDSIIAVFGTNMTTGTAAATGDPSALPTTLANTTVTVTDSKGVARTAQLYYVSPTQINYLVPSATALGPGTVTVTAPNGVSVVEVTVIQTAPGMFMANSSGLAAGSGVFVQGLAQSAFNVATTDSVGDVIPDPINLGTRLTKVYLTLFGTGFRNRASLDNVSIYIGGIYTPALYAGPQSQYPGLDQLNFLVPFSLAGSGQVTIQVSVNGAQANPVNVTIQ